MMLMASIIASLQVKNCYQSVFQILQIAQESQKTCAFLRARFFDLIDQREQVR